MNDFSSENKLGPKGFGPIYKVILPTGQEIAIKKLSRASRQRVVEFKNELSLIYKLQHTNLVQLLCHYIYEQEPMLIYEYMLNKSLDFFLFEYAMNGVISTKSDVYSSRLLLLGIISGRKNNSFYTSERPLNLAGHAWELWNQGEVLQLMDLALKEAFVHDEVIRCVHVALLCIEQNVDDRPNMSNITLMLTKRSVVSPMPKRPAYYARTMAFEKETLSSKELETDAV